MAMRNFLLWLLTAALLGACATSSQQNEPADLVAPGKSIGHLNQLGWEISPPVSAIGAAETQSLSAESHSQSNGQPWSSFVSKIRNGDELKPVKNNAGQGYAIFRGGTLVDLYLWIIY